MNLPDSRKVFYEVLKIAHADLVSFSAIDASLKKAWVRRGYCRAFFAFVESVAFATKRLILDGHAAGLFELSVEQQLLLRERDYDLRDSGTIRERARFLPFRSNFRFVFGLFNQVYQTGLTIDYSGQGWLALQEAMKIRDRIMHPKGTQDFDVSDDDVRVLKQADHWFWKLYQGHHKVLGSQYFRAGPAVGRKRS